jgi:hypothetical protein
MVVPPEKIKGGRKKKPVPRFRFIHLKGKENIKRLPLINIK